MNNEPEKNRYQRFVSSVIKYCQQYSGNRAKLKRADNSATEYESWAFLARHVDLEKIYEKQSFAIIAAAIARSKIIKDGEIGIGEAILRCYDKDHKNDSALLKLRKLLACADVPELCQYLRPLLMLVDSKEIKLNYSLLLTQIIQFNYDNPATQNTIKAKWAKDFFEKENHNEAELENNIIYDEE